MSTVLHFPWGGMGSHYARLEQTHSKQVHCLWGDGDTVVPTHLSKELLSLIPSMNLLVQKGFSHSLVIEDSQLIAELVHGMIKA
jgi:hypothetical protein